MNADTLPTGRVRTLASFLDEADRFGKLLDPAAKPIERAPRLERPIARLNPSRWPKCPLCGVSTLEHDCDPDVTLAALLADAGRETVVEVSRG